MEFHFRKGILVLVIRRFISEENVWSDYEIK